MGSYLDVYYILPPYFWMALAGGAGGLFIDMASKGYIEIPQRVSIDGKYCMTLGFLSAFVAGIFAGIIADTNPLISFLSGAGLGGLTTGVIMRTRKGGQPKSNNPAAQRITFVKDSDCEKKATKTEGDKR